IEYARRAALESAHFALLSIKTTPTGNECRVSHVFDGSPAQRAGLSGNDVLVALGGLRCTTANIDRLLSRYATGDSIELTAFRRDELMRFEVKLATQPPPKFVLTVDTKASKAAQKLRGQWIGSD
ncbi:MAG: PDZ domain-containing protein, partial [Burkholderiaceae bacterium]